MRNQHFVATAALVMAASLLAFSVGRNLRRPAEETASEPAVAAFEPPSESTIPDDGFGAMVRRGRAIFLDTPTHAAAYVGNGLSCRNCHLDRGRMANSAPMWAAWVRYPQFRSKNRIVNTMADRIAGCFRFSMNGTPPPADSDEIRALQAYFFWMATGAPTGRNLPGGGYPPVPRPASPPDIDRGGTVYAERCALCHGNDGQGQRSAGRYVFPPLWGPDTYNKGAGMYRVETAAAFIKANMPLGQGGSLSDQQAWDVAAFINSRERPRDPRSPSEIPTVEPERRDGH